MRAGVGPALRGLFRSRARPALVLLEVAVGFAVIVHSLNLAATLDRAVETDLGIDDTGLFYVEVEHPTERIPTERARAALLALEGVVGVARVDRPPMSETNDLEALSSTTAPGREVFGWSLTG
jgi:hypothetical protein